MLILQTCAPDNSLAIDSYGITATAAMLGQDVTVLFCGASVKQLTHSKLITELETAKEFGVEKIFVNIEDCARFTVNTADLPSYVGKVSTAQAADIIDQHDKILSF